MYQQALLQYCLLQMQPCSQERDVPGTSKEPASVIRIQAVASVETTGLKRVDAIIYTHLTPRQHLHEQMCMDALRYRRRA